MKQLFVLTIFLALYIATTGCEKKPDPTPDPSINFVCRVSQAIPAVPGLYPKGTDGKLYPSTSSSKSAATDEVRELYMADNPDAKRVQVACFSCDIVKDAPGRAICDQ